MIVIDEAGDLTIQVIEYKDGAENQPRTIHEMKEFRVCRKVLVKQSMVFQRLLTTCSFAEAKQNVITLEEDRVFAMETWFRQMHGTLTENSTHNVSLSEMWHVTAAADKYDLCILDLKEWFEDWYKRKPTIDSKDGKHLEARQLLYPCYRFDHASGFARATKYLAYNSTGHITENNPTDHKELHLPHRMIRESLNLLFFSLHLTFNLEEQINAAKGRLRTVIHSRLFEINEELLNADCACKAETLFGYEEALYVICVWPLERVAQRSKMTDILDRLHKLDYKAHEKACQRYCQKDYNSRALQAEITTRNYFDGLCLDCMTNSKTQDYNEDYWCHDMLDEDEFITGCRITHKQPTWYFSFMGRREGHDHFRKRKHQDFIERTERSG